MLKVLLQNKGRAAIKMAIHDPKRAWAYFVRSCSSRWMRDVFSSRNEYEKFSAELESSGLIEQLEENLLKVFSRLDGKTPRGQAYSDGKLSRRHAYCLYGLVRKLAPETIVETGVCNGYSTAVILAALAKNRKGHLHSIDYPEFTGTGSSEQEFWEGKGGAVVPEDRAPGWLIPEPLRGRWTLSLGMTSDLLPGMLEELRLIDMFFHDSEHSFENQMFEMTAAWGYLRRDGFLVCSDINWSDAFDRFWVKARAEGATRRFVDFGLGFIRPKP